MLRQWGDKPWFPGRFKETVVLATFNTSGATLVSVSDASTANFTITLSNLRIGLLVYGWIRNSGSSAITIKVAATTPSGATYDVRGKQSGSAPFDFTATGITTPAATTDYFAFGGTGFRYDSVTELFITLT